MALTLTKPRVRRSRRLDSLEGYVPPQNLQAEQATLGAMLIERDAILAAAQLLTPDDFYRDAHRTLFESVTALAERGEPADFITVQAELSARGVLEAVGGEVYLLALLDAVPTAANVEWYARRVADKARLRRMIEAAMQAIGLARGADADGEGDVAEVLDAAETLIFAASEDRASSGGLVLVGQALADYYAHLEARAEHPELLGGVTTGLAAYDDRFGPLPKGSLTVVGARPSMGKSAISLGVALHVADRLGLPALFFSLEMPAREVAARVASMKGHVDTGLTRRPEFMAPCDWERLSDLCRRYYSARLGVDETPQASLSHIRARCRRFQADQGGLGLVVVDYLQLMGGSRAENRTQEVSEYSAGLKALAKEFDVPVLALSQLSRQVEQRDDKRPRLSDLRESGAVEQDADVVLFLYREAYYAHRGGDPPHPLSVQDAEWIVAKNRNGPTGFAKVGFIPQWAEFVDVA